MTYQQKESKKSTNTSAAKQYTKENVMIVELGIIFAIYGIILIFALVGWIFETVLQYIANTNIWRK